ncbi:MAG: hypothetical protein JWM32_737 [Verrucomicrobia bacterium]|nr:hypothetical protein [Verrucomicrobiota bacterium]
MDQNAESPRWPVLQAVIVAALGVGLLFLWQGRDGFNLWDEGFLWYGAQRVMAGEIPLRDFQAYDPARYYWSAAGMGLLGGNGILALRISVAVFQVFGLAAGLAVAGRGSRARGVMWWLLLALTVSAWMFPRHKIFDASCALGLIAILAFLVERPTAFRHFMTGIIVGVAGMIGRNHGMYGAAGSIVAMAYLAGNGGVGWRGVRAWVLGLMVGFSPMLLLAALAPGFARSIWNGVLFLFEYKSTNLTLPVPWPWTAQFGHGMMVNGLWMVGVGLFFIAVLAFAVGGLVFLVRRRLHARPVPPASVACICLGAPYAHYAFSRADVGHLALGIFPLLIGALAWAAMRSRWTQWIVGVVIAGGSLGVMTRMHPGWTARTDPSWVEMKLGTDRLRVSPGVADEVAMLQRLAPDFAPGSRSIYAAPFWPGAYAVLKRKCPTWEIYPTFPRSAKFQQEEIKRIEAAAPGFVVILDAPLDGREELRFRNTHPLMDQYIRTHFKRLTGYTQNPACEVYAN